MQVEDLLQKELVAAKELRYDGPVDGVLFEGFRKKPVIMPKLVSI